MSNRIDPAKVAAWFKAHPEVRPIRERYLRTNDKGEPEACCGLTGQALEAGKLPTEHLDDLSTKIAAAKLAHSLGISDRYAYGFTKGWDDMPFRESPAAFADGHADGRAAYTATQEALRS